MVEFGAGAGAGVVVVVVSEDVVVGIEDVIVVGAGVVVVGIGIVVVVVVGIVVVGIVDVVVGIVDVVVGATVTWFVDVVVVGVSIAYMDVEPSGVILSSNLSRWRRGDCFIASSPLRSDGRFRHKSGGREGGVVNPFSAPARLLSDEINREVLRCNS
jgi:hypothetical protein